MQVQDFDNIVNLAMARCGDMLVSKRNEYAPDHDVLKNFKDGAEMNDSTAHRALWGYVTKQLVSVKEMVKHEETTDFSLTHWDEKLTDIINYMILLKAIVIEDHWNQADDAQPALTTINKENVPA